MGEVLQKKIDGLWWERGPSLRLLRRSAENCEGRMILMWLGRG